MEYRAGASANLSRVEIFGQKSERRVATLQVCVGWRGKFANLSYLTLVVYMVLPRFLASMQI